MQPNFLTKPEFEFCKGRTWEHVENGMRKVLCRNCRQGCGTMDCEEQAKLTAYLAKVEKEDSE